MSIPVKFANATRDTLIRFDHTFSGQTFTVNIPFAVDSVLFDPDYQLISADNVVGAVPEHGLQTRLQLYPNPANSLLTIVTDPVVTNLAYEIFSSGGQRVKSGILNGRRNQISIIALADGLYSIVFRSGKLQACRTFVKKR